MSHNAALAGIFNDMAKIYSYLGAGERFRALAYQKAAKLVGNMPDDIAAHINKPHHLEKLEGIGESIGEKILEFLDTGKIKKYEELKKQVPY